MVQTFEAGQQLTATRLNALPKGIVARGRRTTNSSTTTSTTGIGVLRIDDVPVKAGRLYRIYTGPLAVVSTVAGDIPRAKVTFTTDGSTPTASSTTLDGTQTNGVIDTNSQSNNDVISALYAPAGDEILSLLLCVLRGSGTGNASINGTAPNIIELVIEDIGVDSGDVGVDV